MAPVHRVARTQHAAVAIRSEPSIIISSMATGIAIVSVVTSAGVAIAVPLIAGRFEQRRLALHVNAARIDELRAVLDEAAPVLREALYELNGAESLLDQGLNQALGGGPTVGEILDRVSSANTRVFEYTQRLMLRLGREAGLVRLYAAANEACADGWSTLVEVDFDGAPYDEARAARAKAALADAEARQAEFLDFAARLVGPTAIKGLPSKP